jgi:hypothetical protein
MRALESEEAVRRLIEVRPERTQTFAVAREALAEVPFDKPARLRSMTPDEVGELATYLDVRAEELDGPLSVVDATCPNCDRRITFLDFVQTAVGSGAHEHDLVRDVLTGRGGGWTTIRGRNGGRPVTCARCGQLARTSEYSEYSSSSYAYA